MSSPRSRRKNRKLARLFKEQNGLCWICGMPMMLSFLPKRNRFDASLDHVIPRLHGGTLADPNVKVAHKYCNSARGAGERESSLQKHIEHIQILLSCPRRLAMLGLNKEVPQ